MVGPRADQARADSGVLGANLGCFILWPANHAATHVRRLFAWPRRVLLLGGTEQSRAAPYLARNPASEGCWVGATRLERKKKRKEEEKKKEKKKKERKKRKKKRKKKREKKIELGSRDQTITGAFSS